MTLIVTLIVTFYNLYVIVTYRFNDYGFLFAFLRNNENQVTTVKKVVKQTINNINLNDTKKEVLNLIEENSLITRNEISESVNRTVRTVQRVLNKLCENKLIKKLVRKKTYNGKY